MNVIQGSLILLHCLMHLVSCECFILRHCIELDVSLGSSCFGLSLPGPCLYGKRQHCSKPTPGRVSLSLWAMLTEQYREALTSMLRKTVDAGVVPWMWGQTNVIPISRRGIHP